MDLLVSRYVGVSDEVGDGVEELVGVALLRLGLEVEYHAEIGEIVVGNAVRECVPLLQLGELGSACFSKVEDQLAEPCAAGGGLVLVDGELELAELGFRDLAAVVADRKVFAEDGEVGSPSISVDGGVIVGSGVRVDDVVGLAFANVGEDI